MSGVVFHGATISAEVQAGGELKAGTQLLVFCQGCSRNYVWTVPGDTSSPPHYHSKSCKRRQYARYDQIGPQSCPHPEKRKYRSGEAAQVAFREHTARKGFGAQPYRCRCGNYHLGNPNFTIIDARKESK